MPDSLRYRWLWLGVGWSVVGAIIYFSLTPSPPQPFNLSDKAEHYLAYLLLTAWFLQIYPRGAARLWVALISIGLGAGLEVLQGLGGVRHFDYRDMLANTLGAFTSLLAIRGPAATLLVRVERLFP
jgi:VanZ family protein